MSPDTKKRQPVDIQKARDALRRFISGKQIMCIPMRRDDDDFLIFDALDELESLRSGRVAIANVMQERERQDRKWGEQNHQPAYWLGILGEEFGELCQAVNETVFNNGPTERLKGGYENMRAEAIQVAAVAVGFVESLDREFREGGSNDASRA